VNDYKGGHDEAQCQPHQVFGGLADHVDVRTSSVFQFVRCDPPFHAVCPPHELPAPAVQPKQ